MIHILTVHWRSRVWIEPQLRQFASLTDDPYRVYSFFTDIDFEDYKSKFYFAAESDIRDHATKLNTLAEIACEAAETPDDLLVFVDSDAFPIARWEQFVREKLASNVLVAVRRDENLGDPQPHPCFCVTTVKFWKEERGDWRKGFEWRNSAGNLVTDVGGNLLMLLEDKKLPWFALTRSNNDGPHPLFFGIYGDLIYHHGAGSRKVTCRLDQEIVKNQTSARFNSFLRFFPMHKFLLKARARANRRTSTRIIKEILRSPMFFQRLAD